jgi:hypothetical protein
MIPNSRKYARAPGFAEMYLASRRTFLATAVGAAACSRPSDDALVRAVRWLSTQQAQDGGWHSHTYGLLRSGQSLTAFVLDALLDVPRLVPAAAVDRALAFIKRNTNSEGSLGLMDSAAPDYPNYATGLAVRAMIRAKASGWEPMVECLLAQQFTQQNGWHRDDPAYGAWGMGGDRRTPPDAGHVDLAMTRYVLEGLATAQVKIPAAAFVYLDRCQNLDGGFFFSTVNTETNKAGDCLSYGSTTADGILALRAAGADDNDPRIVRAKKWLHDHHQLTRVPGFGEGPRAAWGEGLRFYYAAALKRAMPELPVLLPPQRADGSWKNPSNLVKEDDPLIATAFAVRVLAKPLQ